MRRALAKKCHVISTGVPARVINKADQFKPGRSGEIPLIMATAYQMYFNPATNREIPVHGNRYRSERFVLVPYKLVGVQKMSSTPLGTATVPWRLTGFFFKRGRRIQPIATLNLCNTPPIRFPLSTHPQIFYIKWKKSTKTRGCIEYPNPHSYPGKRQQRRHL